jgi:hypothetical protein
MITTALLLLALQDAPVTTPAAPAKAPDRNRLNAIELIVNEEAVTTLDVQREIRRKHQATTTVAEQQQQFAEVATQVVGNLLTIQAGKDMGFDDELINRLVKDDMEATVERMGSVVALGAALDEVEMDPQMLREDKRSAVYRRLWEGSVDGRSAGPGGRPYVDRYVRPGRLLFEFRRADPLRLAPAQIMLQELDILARGTGGVEKALELARQVRDRLLAGEDLDKLADELTAANQGKKSVWEPQDLARVQASPLLGPFVREPSIGKLSDPLPLRPTGELIGYAVLRIRDLDLPDAPVFADGSIQKKLRTQVEARMQSYRRGRELNSLLDAAYVWPPEAFGRAKAEPDAVDN